MDVYGSDKSVAHISTWKSPGFQWPMSLNLDGIAVKRPKLSKWKAAVQILLVSEGNILEITCWISIDSNENEYLGQIKVIAKHTDS